jgi:protein-tyrosine phosphatase
LKELFVSAIGRIDLHSHLLPGIDDGCRTVEESLACVGTLIGHGFVGTVCTPHMGIGAFPDNTPATIADRVATLQEQLRSAKLEYQLWAGGELRLADDTLSWLRSRGAPTLGSSRYVLIDYWGDEWPQYADRAIEYLLQNGYSPILAHPERMDLDDREWDDVLRRLEHLGVWLQGNLKCLAGHEGERVGRRAKQLLIDNRYRVLATDMHGTPDLADRLEGLRTVDQLVGATKLAELLADCPCAILTPKDATDKWQNAL